MIVTNVPTISNRSSSFIKVNLRILHQKEIIHKCSVINLHGDWMNKKNSKIVCVSMIGVNKTIRKNMVKSLVILQIVEIIIYYFKNYIVQHFICIALRINHPFKPK